LENVICKFIVLPANSSIFRSTILYNDIKEESEKLQETTLEEDRAHLSKKWGLTI
jgi:hypothetical protein